MILDKSAIPSINAQELKRIRYNYEIVIVFVIIEKRFVVAFL